MEKTALRYLGNRCAIPTIPQGGGDVPSSPVQAKSYLPATLFAYAFQPLDGGTMYLSKSTMVGGVRLVPICLITGEFAGTSGG